jgi:hypothetical protein
MLHVPPHTEPFDRSHLVYQLLRPMSPEDETRLWSYGVQGIVNLLENNTHAGLAETLSFCYHEEPDIRSIFITIFAKALERSVDLSSAVQENVDKRHSYICDVRPNTIYLFVCSCAKADGSDEGPQSIRCRSFPLA